MWRVVEAYRGLSRSRPLSTAFVVTFAKGSASDMIAQTSFDGRRFDFQRNLSFAFFSGAYLGIGQHYIYNVVFTRVLGSGRDLGTATRKVAADAFVHVPFVYLMLYYPFEHFATGQGSPFQGLLKYKEEAPRVLTTYWMTWPPAHLISFTVLPTELRISFIAGLSFLWLIYLSYASHDRPPPKRDEAS
ncbi:hypothetical protein CTAYLR_010432 [Chrysophaeum taylorii]|uniref:Uncharacterized protein n=1 Tax=Chrysophaeum taylorii TaxID=2483200 RepID=A0AAD7UC16_9STRA|nr:hypothetical protein CTAYLR_010432 [Chrysophaeum taylorii]